MRDTYNGKLIVQLRHKSQRATIVILAFIRRHSKIFSKQYVEYPKKLIIFKKVTLTM